MAMLKRNDGMMDIAFLPFLVLQVYLIVPIAHYIAHVTGWLENKWVDEIKK